VYVEASLKERHSRPNFKDSELVYEPSANPDLIVNTGKMSIAECSSAVMELIEEI